MSLIRVVTLRVVLVLAFVVGFGLAGSASSASTPKQVDSTELDGYRGSSRSGESCSRKHAFRQVYKHLEGNAYDISGSSFWSSKSFRWYPAFKLKVKPVLNRDDPSFAGKIIWRIVVRVPTNQRLCSLEGAFPDGQQITATKRELRKASTKQGLVKEYLFEGPDSPLGLESLIATSRLK